MSLPFHNFDLSQITDETERINMIMVVQSYIEENFIKKNSTNPNKAWLLYTSDLQEPENEEPAVVVPQKQPMAGMANIFSLFDF